MSNSCAWCRAVAAASLVIASACSKREEPKPVSTANSAPPLHAAGDAGSSAGDGAVAGEGVANAKSGPIRDEELIALFVRSDIRGWSPEEARRRLARLELSEMSPMPGSQQLVAETPTLRVTLNYLPDEGGSHRFADARVELPVADGKTARARYEALCRRIESVHGAPSWRKDDESYPSRGYPVDAKLEVMLGAMTKAAEAPPMAVLSLAVK